MDEAIKNFAQQFSYKPEIQNADAFQRLNKFIVVGMGGSHLAAGLIKLWKPELDIIIHKNYGLPKISPATLGESTIIISSYSGNTEEVVAALEEVCIKKLSTIIISTNGKLIEEAKKHSFSYIQLPDTGIQPRSALGFSFLAFLKIIGEEGALQETAKLVQSLKPLEYEEKGREIADMLRGHVPIIYASAENEALAYDWKIKFNETGKIPAFYNIFPELNHNEMTGFDVANITRDLSKNFFFLLLKDPSDNPRITKRMQILEKLYSDRGLPIQIIELRGKNIYEKIFASLVLADWAAYYTATNYNLDPEQVPVVEEFKKLIKN